MVLASALEETHSQAGLPLAFTHFPRTRLVPDTPDTDVAVRWPCRISPDCSGSRCSRIASGTPPPSRAAELAPIVAAELPLCVTGFSAPRRHSAEEARTAPIEALLWGASMLHHTG